MALASRIDKAGTVVQCSSSPNVVFTHNTADLDLNSEIMTCRHVYHIYTWKLTKSRAIILPVQHTGNEKVAISVACRDLVMVEVNCGTDGPNC